MLDPEIQPIVDLMNAAPGPPAHLIPVEQARATHDRDTEIMSGPGPEVAEVRDVEVPGPGGPIPRARVDPRRGRRAAAARRLRARRRLGHGLARRVRPDVPGAGQRVRRRRGEHRLPAGARASVPGGGRRRPRRRALARVERRVARRRRRADGDRGRLGRRQPGRRDRAAAAGRGRLAAALPGARVPGLRQRAEHAVLPRVRPGLRPQHAEHEALLGALPRRRRRDAAGRVAAARRGPRRAAADVHPHRGQGRAALRGGGLRGGARARRRAGDPPLLRRRRARLLPLAGPDAALAAGDRRGRRGAARGAAMRHVAVPTPADLDAAAAVVAERLAPTPLVAAPALGEDVWLKLETLQPTGSFKVRGGLAALARLGGEPVVTASAGNAGLGVAWAASALGVRATIVVAETASPAKVAALEALPVTLVRHGEDYDAAEAHALTLAGATYVSSYNDTGLIAGQASIGRELDARIRGPLTVVAPTGGGGLAAGLGLWAAQRPGGGARVVAVEAERSRAMSTALAAGELTPVVVGDTIADGLAGNIEPGSVTFPLVRDHVAAVVAGVRGRDRGGHPLPRPRARRRRRGRGRGGRRRGHDGPGRARRRPDRRRGHRPQHRAAAARGRPRRGVGFAPCRASSPSSP